MTPPQTNATLTRVTQASAAERGRDDWDTPGVEPTGGGASKWTGSAAAYYREAVQRVVTDGDVNLIPVRTLYVGSDVALAAGIDTNDVLRFTTTDGRTIDAVARVVSIAQLPGVPAAVQTARLDLDV